MRRSWSPATALRTVWVPRFSCAACLGWGSCPTMSSRRHRSRWLACRSGCGSRSVSWSTTAPGSRLAPIICGRFARYLGWRLAEEFQWRELDEFLFARAMEHDPPKLLFRLGCEYLASSRVTTPGRITVLMRVAAAREKSRAETWQRVAHLVEPTRAAE